MSKKKELIGKKQDNVICIGVYSTKNYQIKVELQCDCGNKLEAYADNWIKKGSPRTCKDPYCPHSQYIPKEHKPLANRLRQIKNRCYNPKHKSYKNYGAIGVTVCEEWLESPKSFIKWSLENGYEPHLQIDREDSTKEYSPTNCRWVTQQVNLRNKRNKRIETFAGITKSLAEWSDYLEMPYGELHSRIKYDTGRQRIHALVFKKLISIKLLPIKSITHAA